MIVRMVAAIVAALSVAGCITVEGGFKYEYDGHVYRADGRTPVKGVAVRMTRPNSPEAPDLPDKLAKSAVKYVDRSQKEKTDAKGHYLGVLETVQGWKYHEFMGMASGPTKPPDPPMLNEVILYVQEKGGNWIGYRMPLPPETQASAISGIRKVHVPDLLLPDKPATTRATTTGVVGK
ncbi:MAG TPA: hypothetical protein VH475_14810 [Tepidisphaeraceae bacterium]|jgi:hypothetical protein